MSTSDIEILLDKENDVLYVFDNRFSKEKTVNIHVNADMVARFEINTHKTVGFTITDFSEAMPHFKDKNEYELMEVFEIMLDTINATHSLEHR